MKTNLFETFFNHSYLFFSLINKIWNKLTCFGLFQ
jgi:hypothetical protein